MDGPASIHINPRYTATAGMNTFTFYHTCILLRLRFIFIFKKILFALYVSLCIGSTNYSIELTNNMIDQSTRKSYAGALKIFFFFNKFYLFHMSMEFSYLFFVLFTI